MSLEEKMDALTAALTENTAVRKAALAAGSAGTKAPAGAKTTAKAFAGPTAEEVKVAAQAFAKEHGKPAAKALIAKHGGADLASIPAANYADFIAASKNPPEAPEDEDGL